MQVKTSTLNLPHHTTNVVHMCYHYQITNKQDKLAICFALTIEQG